MEYYEDVDTGNIVRKCSDGFCLEYRTKSSEHWIQTQPNSSYEREFWFGEGNTCLFPISEQKAIDTITSWECQLSEREIRSAQKCYLFGGNVLYIITDDTKDVAVFYPETNTWRKREQCSFWDSWDLDPTLFIPISNEKAVTITHARS